MGARGKSGAEKKEPAVALATVCPGARVRVVSLQGGWGMTHRLAALGIYPGVELAVVRGGRGGPVIAEVRGSRVLVGRGMATRVMVRPVAEEEQVS